VPTYSYRCRDCEAEFDIQQAFSDDPLTQCPECQGSLRKLFSPVGVTFQGSGFYRTDSRAEAKKSSGSTDSGGSKKKSGKKKESKKAKNASS